VIAAANDMSDPHLDIVNDNAYVICRLPVGSQENEVFDHVARDRDFSDDGIVERHRTVRYFESNGTALPVFEPAFDFIGSQLEARPVVLEIGFAGCGLFAFLIE
jgi:hypothetical protein